MGRLRLNVGNPAGVAAPEVYRAWHWGNPHEEEIDWADPDYPDELVECGRLWEFHYVPTVGRLTPGQAEASGIQVEIPEPYRRDCHLAFDAQHPVQRLYFCLSRAAMSQARRKFWRDRANWHRLDGMARIAGGRHGRMGDYPEVYVQPVGRLTHVVYATLKGDDGPTAYIHRMGEKGGVAPILSVDSHGRLWVAGGSYAAPEQGITQ